MQIRSKVNKGYITIFLTLSFGIIMPLLLALIEGAAAGTTRLQSQLVADLGIDSVFAEYHKELFRQYGLFFIDDSYGASNGSVSQVEKHLDDYMAYNTVQNKEKGISGYYSFQRLKKEYLEIEEVSFATDDECQVWKDQAIQYMKEKYGEGIIEDVKQKLNTIEEIGVLDENVDRQIHENTAALKEIVEHRSEEEEWDKEQEAQGVSFQKVFDAIDNWRNQELLAMVLEDGSHVSQLTFDKQKTVSTRYEQGLCNKGSGITNTENEPNDFTDELLYDAYVMNKYGNYRTPKSDSYLSYETEYILFGNENDMTNLRKCVERLLLMREVSNYLYLNTKDDFKKNEVRVISTAVCSLCGVPELSELLTQVTLGLWAYGESVIDVKCLLQGGKVSILKERNEWNLSITSILSPNAWRSDYGKGNNKMTSMSYEDYLKILLATMNRREKMLRSLDIVELDIRATAGNENFRIDQCIDAMFVSFGFSDSYGHEYVFSRQMRYE